MLCLLRFLVLSCGGSFPTRSGSFRPSSGSSLVSFRSYGLWSLTFFFTLRCFVSALHLLYSVLGCLFLRWTFFVCTIAASVSSGFRVLLLWSVTRPVLFLFAPPCSTPIVLSALVCCFMFFLLGSVSRIFSLPSSFCLSSFHPLYWWGHSLPLFCVFLLVRPSFLVCYLCLYCPLLFFPFLHEVLGRFLPWFRVSPFQVSLHTWSLRVSFFLSWFRPFPLVSSSSPLCVLWYCLFHPWAFP